MNKIIELPLTADYVSSWDNWCAMRELLQNAIDSGKKWELSREADTLLLTQEDTLLPIQSLLLGCSSKTNDNSKIGKFGEGYKLALLVLARNGLHPRIINNQDLWKIDFAHSKTFDTETLQIEIYPKHCTQYDEHQLIFRILCTDEEEAKKLYELCKTNCLHINQSIVKNQSTRGDILLSDSHAGKVFVNGLFVTDVNARFGYNIKPEYLELDRDRKTVNNWDFCRNACLMWLEDYNHMRVAELIRDEIPEFEGMEYRITPEIAEACATLFQKEHPNTLPVADHSDLIRAQNQQVHIVPRHYMKAITSSTNWPVTTPVILSPKQLLEQWLEANKRHMRSKAVKSLQEFIINNKEVLK